MKIVRIQHPEKGRIDVDVEFLIRPAIYAGSYYEKLRQLATEQGILVDGKIAEDASVLQGYPLRTTDGRTVIAVKEPITSVDQLDTEEMREFLRRAGL